jgi:putative Ca2+/H+ antiporter (TMEM165/GDT1 family)
MARSKTWGVWVGVSVGVITAIIVAAQSGLPAAAPAHPATLAGEDQ